MTTPTVSLHFSMGSSFLDLEPLSRDEVRAYAARWAKFAKRKGLDREAAKGAVIATLREDMHVDEMHRHLIVCAGCWLMKDTILKQQQPCGVLFEITETVGGNYKFEVRLGTNEPGHDVTEPHTVH